MNQTTKRLNIINLAISITDIETIQLQILKLGLLKADENIQEIINALQEQNYIQAQGMIERYLSTPSSEDVIQRSSQTENFHADEEPEPIENVQFFNNHEGKNSSIEIDINDFINEESGDIALKSDDLRSDKKQINSNDTLLELPPRLVEKKSKKRDDFDDLLALNSHYVTHSEDEEQSDTFFTSPQAPQAEQKETEDTFFDSSMREQNLIQKASVSENSGYAPVLDIREKFELLQERYPCVYEIDTNSPVVDALLTKISHEYYLETEIEETISYAKKLIQSDKHSQAIALLLICASTPSTFAQLILARELYKGELFEKDNDEAFDILEALVTQKYPEAMCDLAQFYEYGIGTRRDKKRAIRLYEEAMERGLNRAKSHYIRLKKSTKGLFSFLK